MKLYSWNVNGIRAAQKKGFLDWLADVDADIVCLQETKAHPDQLDDELRNPEGYHTYWAVAEKKGYSGVGLYSRIEPNNVQIGLGIPEFDSEGRTIIADYDEFTFIGAYFPNGSRDHSRVPYKMSYKEAFLDYCNARRAEGRHIVFCGDVNTAHNEIDLARPKQNTKTTGFLPIEREWLDKATEQGYKDVYRQQNPEKADMYTWWSFRSGARERNVGWRIDYFFVDEGFLPKVSASEIHTDTMGSDHCPVSIELAL